jgi:sulfate adenylyltransferase subunit 1
MSATLPLEVGNELEVFLKDELNKELLRFTTAGSVDDGKSTLIGRLLHDCKAVYEDQLDSVKKSRVNRSGRAIDFSLLTDGLRAEREQGITIDVAYRYFSTPHRKFIIADTPGHEQYTRNMATGASTSDLAVILIDATKGLLSQTRRHAYIASLLGIDSVLAAVNKMDLAGYSEDVFRRLEAEFSELASALGITLVQCVPISALDGDNVVTRSEKTPWYFGPTLLEHLESVPIRTSHEAQDLRFPVQSVIRPDGTFRGFAGRVASGGVHRNDEVLVLPSKRKTRVESIVSFDGEMDSAESGDSVVLKLRDEIDISRGDLLVSLDAEPHVSNRFSAMVVWLHSTPLEPDRTYLAKHAGRLVKAKATRIRYRVDINQLTEHPADHLEMNEIASVEFETSQPLYFDPYHRNRTTGSLILIDPLSNATVGAVMIREALADESARRDERQPSVTNGQVTLKERSQRHRHRPAILAVNGERSLAENLERELLERGFEVALINYNEVPSAAWQPLFSTLWSLGFVIVVWAETRIRRRQQGVLAKIAAESFYDLSSLQSQASAETHWKETLRIAETLRIDQQKSIRETEN